MERGSFLVVVAARRHLAELVVGVDEGKDGQSYGEPRLWRSMPRRGELVSMKTVEDGEGTAPLGGLSPAFQRRKERVYILAVFVNLSAMRTDGNKLVKARSSGSLTSHSSWYCWTAAMAGGGSRTSHVDHHVRVGHGEVVRRAYERATYGLRESNFTILTCNCCTDSARSKTHVHHTRCSARATHLISTVYKDDLTGDCQLVSKMHRKAQKKTNRQDPKKRAAEDTRVASDDEVNRRCTHLQRASTASTRQRGNRTEIVRCKHVKLTYHLRNVRCTQPLTARRVVQTTYVHLASDLRCARKVRHIQTNSSKEMCHLSVRHNLRTSNISVTTRRTCFCVLSTCKNEGKRRGSVCEIVVSTYNSLTTCATYDARNRSRPDVAYRPHSYTLRNRANDVRLTCVYATPSQSFQNKT
ncbi:hypothetical protein Bbelb_364520 [Branchiostoma belcheri]|nr:hypothetical protein Bbelb_364520 [Branchiostoma belcheri]